MKLNKLIIFFFLSVIFNINFTYADKSIEEASIIHLHQVQSILDAVDEIIPSNKNKNIYEIIMSTKAPTYLIELFHGYTYSAHPVACAASIASLDILQNDNLVERVQKMSPIFEQELHSLKGLQYVADIRNYGLAGAFTIEAVKDQPALRPYQIAMKCWDKGFYVRYGGDTIQLGLPFIVTEQEIKDVVGAISDSIKELQ